jgi:RNA-directed DNA polymerase
MAGGIPGRVHFPGNPQGLSGRLTGRITTAPRPGKSLARGNSSMYTDLCSWNNLLLAFRKAAKGKRGHPCVAAFEYNLEDNLLQLQADLTDLTYHPGNYSSFYIHEPKKRLISAAPFCDRVIHHALCNLIEPVFERSFISTSFANRVGKGSHKAINLAQQSSRKLK